MSLAVNTSQNLLFVYSPLTATSIKQEGSPLRSAQNSNATDEQSKKTQNNLPKGYKNEPDVNVTGEKLLFSMPDKKNSQKNNPAENMSQEEKDQVMELKKRDAEVKSHEQAHMAAGGAHVKGAPSYTYQTGPDGNQYAVGGEVQIDTSPVKGDPQATIIKAQTVISAALAPAEPSGQDKAVAAQARQTIAKAQAELSKQTSENKDETVKPEGEKEINDTIMSLIDIMA